MCVSHWLTINTQDRESATSALLTVLNFLDRFLSIKRLKNHSSPRLMHTLNVHMLSFSKPVWWFGPSKTHKWPTETQETCRLLREHSKGKNERKIQLCNWCEGKFGFMVSAGLNIPLVSFEQGDGISAFVFPLWGYKSWTECRPFCETYPLSSSNRPWTPHICFW